MIVRSLRSGLVEAEHPVAVSVVDSAGRILLASGDSDRDFFLRSAIKPVQAAVAQRSGADLVPEELAVAAASHRGHPVHVAMVRRMLLGVGLEEGYLLCPPDRPMSPNADRGWARRGIEKPAPVFHNCSGKHAALLRSCVASGWPLEYTAADHPLQVRIARLTAEVAGRTVTPSGIDGCGIPTLRSDVAGLARVFATLAVDADLGEVRSAVMRYGPLTADGDSPEAEIARWLPVVAKGGAEGAFAIAWPELGIGGAAKCWTGQRPPAVAALLTALDRLGMVAPHPRDMLRDLMSPPSLGGGARVGALHVE